MKQLPYWWGTVPSLYSWPPTRTELPNKKVDVAIIGAGYTGLSAARHLARAGASTVVLERERVGWGASSRNGGQVLTGLRIDPATLVARYGESRARQLFDLSLESIARLESLISSERIDCEYERTGHLQAAWKPRHFDDFRREQDLLARVFLHTVDLVPRQHQRSELGSDAYHGVLVDERSAAMNPAAYVNGLAAIAVRAGAVVAEQAPVQRVARHGTGWKLSTARGDVDAGDVLLATDGYTDATASDLQKRLVAVGSFVIATVPLGEEVASTLLPRRRVAFDSKHFLYYFRLTDDRRLLFGGRATFSEPTAEATARAANILRRGMVKVFPELRDVVVEYAWSGNVAFTRDQMPRAGRLQGLYYSAGYCGHGIAMATYLGELIARRIAGEPIEHPLMDDSFPAIPLNIVRRGRPWFLPLIGAYYKLLDYVD